MLNTDYTIEDILRITKEELFYIIIYKIFAVLSYCNLSISNILDLIQYKKCNIPSLCMPGMIPPSFAQ